MKLLPAICLLTLCVSCNKLRDIIKEHGTSNSPCQINTVTDTIFNPETKEERIATCHYDQHGNPTSVTYNRRETGFSWFFFTYDKYQRLAEFKDENVETHSYVYEGNNMLPSRDTIRTTFFSTYVERYTYDAKGRIIHVKGIFIKSDFGDPGFDYDEQYQYNSKGNLVGDYNYDNKVSVYSTNYVWQFIHKNYSVNNLIPAKTYNQKGLPLKFGTGASQPFFGGYFNGSTVTYNCK